MSSNWLVDADNPLLTERVLARIDDAARPDRLTWNVFRTLALWDTDVWVPRLLEMACGDGTVLPTLEWAGASVLPWATGLVLDDAADVVIDGPRAMVVARATLRLDVPLAELGGGALEAVTDALGTRQSALVVVVPPEAPDPGADLGRAAGWLTWRDLGVLALDLAEEADELRAEQVHRLAGELQDQFPGIVL